MREIWQLKDESVQKVYLNRLTKELGFEYFAYYFQPSDIRTTPYLLSNYSKTWEKEYIENELGKIDPVYLQSRDSLTPFFWGGEEYVRDLTRQQRRYFLLYCQHGGTHGYTIPIHSPHCSFGVLSLSTNHLTDLIVRSVNTLSIKLHVSAIYFHELILNTRKSATVSFNLTSREKECLVLISNGKKHEDVARGMGVSKNTVQFHLKNIKRKMNVSTVPQAVALANSKQVIYM